MASILSYIPTLNLTGAALCKFCLSSVKDYSKHDITLCGMDDIGQYDCDDFDIVHIHSHIQSKFFEIKKAKVIYGVHSFNLNCAMGGFVCSVLNRFLDEPLTCLNCLGYMGMKTAEANLKTSIRMAKKADMITVHSEFMKEFYHAYNPVYLPLPMETELLTVSEDREDYIFYTGRLSFEKNPYGFVEVVNQSGMKAKMVIYDLVNKYVPGRSNTHYDDLFKMIKKNKNIELIMNPSLMKMIWLVQHAKFTVLPYFFAEPFGIAAANSVLCGTPLVAFPYGNLRNMSGLLPRTLDEMVKVVKMDDEEYLKILEETKKRGDELRMVHDPVHAVKIWDKVYENLSN